VEYSKKNIKFNVEGWPDDVPFRQPSRLGGNQLRKIWESRGKISFTQNITTAIAQRQSQSSRSMLHNNDEQEASEIDVETEMEEMVGEMEDGSEKVKRAKHNSLVRKGDVVPLLAPGSDGHNFWLFLCASKCKRDGSIKGKWLDRVGDGLNIGSCHLEIPLERTVFSGIPRRIAEKFYLVIVLTWKMLRKESSSCLLQLTTTCMILQRCRCNLLQQIGISRVAPLIVYSKTVALFSDHY